MIPRIGEPFRVKGGAEVKRALPLFKWRRKEGMATFLRNLIDLRKTVVLCASCERKMPRRWESRYNYAFVRGYYAECAACDWCRLQDASNMYCAVDGEYHQKMVHMEKLVKETRARDHARQEKDARYFIGV